MSEVTVDIGGSNYTIACRDGEEAHLRGIAAIVDDKAKEARDAVGGVSEVRQLLFASLLLADELNEARQAKDGTIAPPTPSTEGIAAIERLADRIETLASRLETSA